MLCMKGMVIGKFPLVKSSPRKTALNKFLPESGLGFGLGLGSGDIFGVGGFSRCNFSSTEEYIQYILFYSINDL